MVLRKFPENKTITFLYRELLRFGKLAFNNYRISQILFYIRVYLVFLKKRFYCKYYVFRSYAIRKHNILPIGVKT